MIPELLITATVLTQTGWDDQRALVEIEIENDATVNELPIPAAIDARCEALLVEGDTK